MKKYYIPVAIPYANGKPHLGHAIEAVYADVLARHYRNEGAEVFLSMGMDEHGQKIVRTAEGNGTTPQEHVDSIAESFVELFTKLEITNDDFIRTSQERHHASAQVFWQRAMESGDIEKDVYEGLYCVGCEAYKTEKDLIDGKCPDHQVEPEQVREENYFFRLSRYQDRLLEWYESNPDFVIPKAKFNEMKELVKNGLEDIPVSREKSKLSWGVPVPGDEDHVMYVWFDALVNYLSVIGFGDEARGKEVEKWWPADMHIIGKDINRFHSILWPAMLMAAGIPLPHHIGVHGHVTVGGQKMSKSVGNVIDPLELIEQYGAEPVRYYFLREIPFSNDGDFSYERLREIYTAHLANGLGNLVSRVTNMIEKYCDGVLTSQPLAGKEYTAPSKEIEQLEFHKALENIWKVVTDANELIEEKKPWELAKSNNEELNILLAHLLYCLEFICAALQPYMPETAKKIGESISGDKIVKAQPLFPRLEE